MNIWTLNQVNDHVLGNKARMKAKETAKILVQKWAIGPQNEYMFISLTQKQEYRQNGPLEPGNLYRGHKPLSKVRYVPQSEQIAQKILVLREICYTNITKGQGRI